MVWIRRSIIALGLAGFLYCVGDGAYTQGIINTIEKTPTFVQVKELGREKERLVKQLRESIRLPPEKIPDSLEYVNDGRNNQEDFQKAQSELFFGYQKFRGEDETIRVCELHKNYSKRFAWDLLFGFISGILGGGGGVCEIVYQRDKKPEPEEAA